MQSAAIEDHVEKGPPNGERNAFPPGRLLLPGALETFRNDYTATAIADYAVRARPGAPVALPLSWNELDALEAGSQFTMKDVLARLKRKKPALPPPQRLPRP